MTDTSITKKVEQYIQTRIDGIKWEYGQLQDLATGKQTFKQYLQNYADAHKLFFMQSETIREVVEHSKEAKDIVKNEWEKAKQDFWKDMEKDYPNIRDSYNRYLKDNEMEHKYDMSAAAKVNINGHQGYTGMREKPSFWKRLQNVLSGKKSLYVAVRDNSRVVRKADALFKAALDSAGNGRSPEDTNALRKKISAMRISIGAQKPEQMQNHNNVYEAVKAYCVINAMATEGVAGISVGGMDITRCTDIIKNAAPNDLQSAVSSFRADTLKPSNMSAGMNEKILAGVDNLQERFLPQDKQQSKYAGLDEGQFRVAMGAAYENLVRIEHFNTPNDVKKEVLDEIKQVLNEAQKRYPNAGETPKQGSYFQDADVAAMEQQLMPYMREWAKQDKVFAADVNRYEAWRDGKNATIMKGALKVEEMPFENSARWPNRDKNFTPKSDEYGSAVQHFFLDPYEKGANVMSQKEFLQTKQKVAELKLR